jgi:mRNA interferase RelE/StbE
MAKYRIYIKQSAVKELESIPKKDLGKIIKRIQSLYQNPRPHGCQKLSARERYRIRQGNYRIIYSIQEEELTVHIYKIGHRREIYRS